MARRYESVSRLPPPWPLVSSRTEGISRVPLTSQILSLTLPAKRRARQGVLRYCRSPWYISHLGG